VSEYVDAHAHLGPHGPFCIPAHGAADMVRRMDALGVERLVLSSHAAFSSDHKWGNDLAARACADHPGRIFAYAGANPNYPEEVREELKRCFSRPGFVGIKLHAVTHECKLEDPKYADAWQWAAERGCPVLVHYWDPSPICGPDNLKEVASRYAKVQIIVAHMGGLGTVHRALPDLAAEHPNLWFDTCCSRSSRGTIEYLIEKGLGGRLLYGSDMPFIDPGSQLGKVLYADIPEDSRAAVLGGNARRLFGWEN